MMRRALGLWLVSGLALFGGCGGGAFGSAASDNAGTAGTSGSTEAGKSGSNSSSAGTHAAAGTSAASGGAADNGNDPGGAAPSETAGAGGAAEAPSECPCSAPTPSCESGKCVALGPSMVKADSFYVDSTEVTVADYAKFLKAKGDDTSKQSPECAWNNSFEPLASAAGPDAGTAIPVTGVDYCDAAAYCAWADKRLCGKIGGGPVTFAELSGATSQWFSACGGPAGQQTPYGGPHQDGACNDASGAGKLAPVGSFMGCSGFYGGVSDMLGNAAEWVDACDANVGAADGCETIGGSFVDMPTCSSSSLKHRNERLPTVGFRCCSR